MSYEKLLKVGLNAAVTSFHPRPKRWRGRKLVIGIIVVAAVAAIGVMLCWV